MSASAQRDPTVSNQTPCVVTLNGTLVPTKAALKIASVILLLTQFALAVKCSMAETYHGQAGTEPILYSLPVIRQIVFDILCYTLMKKTSKKKTKQNKHKQKHTMESIDSVYLDLLVAI